VDQKKISAKEAAADIKAEMSDDEIMKKYKLSAKGLQSLLDKLHRANILSTEEYNKRVGAAEQSFDLVGEGGEQVSPSSEKSLEVLKDFSERFKFSKEDLERLKTASLKDIKQLMDKYNISGGEAKELLKTLGISAGSFLTQTADKLKDGARRLKKALQQRQSTTTSVASFGLYNIKIVAGGAILGAIGAAVLTTYWGTARTSTKWFGKSHGTTSLKWIMVCAILGAILAFCVSRILKKRRSRGGPTGIATATAPVGDQSSAVDPESHQPVPKAPQSGNQISDQEYEDALRKIESARRDLFGIAGDVGTIGVGAAGGGIASVVIAAFFGATNIWGLTRAAKWVGWSFHSGTPWIWIIGCAIVGAVLAFSVSRFVRRGGISEARTQRNIEEIKAEIDRRRKSAQKTDVDKKKFDNLMESLTMLLSNKAITPEEYDQLINGIRNGTISYEFAFDAIEEYLKE
jgi:hypothetical protein